MMNGREKSVPVVVAVKSMNEAGLTEPEITPGIKLSPSSQNKMRRESDDGIADIFVSTALPSCLGYTAFLHPASPENRSKRRKPPPAHLIPRYRRYHRPIVLLPLPRI